MSTQLELNSPLAPPLPIRRFSVDQYRQLGELGILTPEDRVELLEGWIVEKMNRRPIHGYIVRLLSDIFGRELPPEWFCQCQLPITTQRSEPEPDLAIVRGTHSDYRSRHPSGRDCPLIIEVADTSLEKDRSKATIYHDAGVEEYWIVNVAAQTVEQYRFADKALTPTILPSDSTAIASIGDREIRVGLSQLF